LAATEPAVLPELLPEGELPVDALPDVVPELPPLIEPLLPPGELVEAEPEPLDPEAAVFNRTCPLASRQCVAAETLLFALLPPDGELVDCADAATALAPINAAVSNKAFKFIESTPWICSRPTRIQ
jgi:hypothetical protein